MPRAQVAKGSHYSFGAKNPGAADDDAVVLCFRRKFNQGGDFDMNFEAPVSDVPVSVTVQFSEDGNTWNDSTAAENGEAVVAEDIAPRTNRHFRVHMRPKLDEYMRILARGSDRASVTIKGNELQEIKNIRDFLGGGSGE